MRTGVGSSTRGTSKRRRHRARRAVSETVAVLLLVAIVVGAGIVVYAFAGGALGGLSGSFSGLISGQGSAVAERFVVEQAAFTFSGTTGADVYVRNVGAVPVTLVSVFVVDQSTSTFVAQVPISDSLGAGGLVDIPHATLAFAPLHGHTYSFTVTSSSGNSVVYVGRAI